MSDFKCQNCFGKGKVPVVLPIGIRDIGCVMCNGSGNLSSRAMAWLRLGERHRIARVEREEGPAACAARLGVTLRELADMEHGRADPARLEG